MPASIRGAETWKLGEDHQSKFTTAIKDALANHTVYKGTNATFLTASHISIPRRLCSPTGF